MDDSEDFFFIYSDFETFGFLIFLYLKPSGFSFKPSYQNSSGKGSEWYLHYKVTFYFKHRLKQILQPWYMFGFF